MGRGREEKRGEEKRGEERRREEKRGEGGGGGREGLPRRHYLQAACCLSGYAGVPACFQ